MREIKFRGKRLDNNEWVYGYYAHHDDYFRHRETHGIYTDFADSMPESDGYSFYPDFFAVNPETVGQFTGLYDKNGKEIYEGDVLLWNERKLFVKWRQEDCRYVLIGCHDNDYVLNAYKCNIEDDFRVIGNIYDNPELVKGGEK